MKQIEIKDLADNFIETFSKEWMLVTAGSQQAFNTMTANWGGIGYLWNKPVVFVFIRPERYTFEFIEEQEYFTLSFLGNENKEIHKVCGSKSGRDIDKVKATGLEPLFTDKGNIFFEQSRLSIECRKLYTDTLKEGSFLDDSILPKWYDSAHGNLHKVYIAEITGVWVKE